MSEDSLLEDPLQDVRWSADFLRVRPSTLYDWCRLGKVPHYKIGGLIRFRRSELEEFLQASHRGGK